MQKYRNFAQICAINTNVSIIKRDNILAIVSREPRLKSLDMKIYVQFL